MSYTSKTPYNVGATVQYDPSGNHDPNASTGNIKAHALQPDGSYTYTYVPREPGTGRVFVEPPIYDVLQSSVYMTDPTPGPGNDL